MDSYSEGKPLIGVFTTSTELIIRVWDDAMATMTGIDANAAVGKHIKELAPDIEARGVLARFEHVRDAGTSEVLAPAFHKNLFSCPPQRSSTRFAEMRQLVTISALRGKDAIDGLIIVVEDVTSRMEREKELAEDLKNPDPAVRLEAAKSVAGGVDPIGDADATHVIEALADKNWRVRRKLVDAMAKRAAPEAVAALLEAVRKEHLNFGMLNGALQVLQETSIDTTATLLEFLRSDDHDLRMQAALALGQKKNKEAVGYLIAALDDENANVRYHAIEALGNLQANDAVYPLLAIAESRDFFLSFAALDALKRIGDPSAAGRVGSLLDDDLLREAAAGTLGTTGNIDTVEQIVKLLNDGDLSAAVACDALSSLW
ncbi:MAG TPA: HEAT repeat domain-containing protein, partial [Pyrinomonadaceae bacterium]|nr:HEAT repeat domain-containing protein [Pyrinomonadaceae bacterium]